MRSSVLATILTKLKLKLATIFWRRKLPKSTPDTYSYSETSPCRDCLAKVLSGVWAERRSGQTSTRRGYCQHGTPPTYFEVQVRRMLGGWSCYVLEDLYVGSK